MVQRASVEHFGAPGATGLRNVLSRLSERRRAREALPAALRIRWSVAAFIVFFVAAAAWSMASPLYSGPDESSHASRAFGVAHGQYLVHVTTVAGHRGSYIIVPKGWGASAQHEPCFAFLPARPASCLKPLTNDKAPMAVTSTATSYNPLYYFVVGLPSRIFTPARALRAMRLMSSAVCGILLAWAVTAAAISSRPKFAASAVVFGITPMVLYLAGVINPSGVELSGALACWVCLFLAARSEPGRVRSVLMRRAALAACAVVMLRVISPLWVVIIGAFVLLTAGLPLKRLVDRTVLGWSALVVVVTLVAVSWSRIAGTLALGTLHRPLHYTLLKRIALAWGTYTRERHMITGQVGNFGWLDTQLPLPLLSPWFIAASALVLAALVFGRWRDRIALLSLLVLIFGLPVLINALSWNTTGSIWQPRYTMPITLGLIALSGLILADRLPVRVKGTAAGAVMGSVVLWTGVGAFVFAASRYIVGLGHPITLTGGRWQPPLGASTWVGVEAVALLVLVAGALVLPGQRGRREVVSAA